MPTSTVNAIFLIIIPIIALIVFIIYRYLKKNSPEYKEKERIVEQKNREIDDIVNKYHFDKIYTIVSKKLGIDTTQKIIAYYTPQVSINNSSIDFKTYNFKDIIECEILEDNETILKSSAGRAAVGGIIAGGVGAVVGASSRGTQGVANRLVIRVGLNNILEPSLIITFIDKQISRTTPYYQSNYSKAIEIYSTIKSIIYNNAVQQEVWDSCINEDIR